MSSPALTKMGLNPTSGCCRERLPRKFGGRERGGCFLEGEPRQGRWEEEPKGITEAALSRLFKLRGEAQARGLRKRIGLSGI